MKRLLLLMITISMISFIQLVAKATEPVELFFHLPLFSNKCAKLAYYYGNKIFLADSILLDTDGRSNLKGEYNEGLYLLLLPDSSTFEFVITGNTHCSIINSDDHKPGAYTIEGNAIIEAYAHYETVKRSNLMAIDSLRKKALTSNDAIGKSGAKYQIQHKQALIDSLSNDFISRYDGSLPANYVKASMPVKMPITESADSGLKRDSTRWISSLNYFHEHFFDNIDWNDARLIYTPVIADKVNYFLDKLTPQKPLQLEEAIRKIIEKPLNSELREFILNLLLSKYGKLSYESTSEYAYIYLVENYILSDTSSFLSGEEKKRLQEECMRLKPVCVLSMAPDISLPDKSGKLQTLYQVNSTFTLLYFWDYNCSTCRRVLADLVKMISTYKYIDIQVFTIYTGNDFDIWKAFLAKKIPTNWINTYQSGTIQYTELYNLANLPAIFLLDRNKVIVGKNLSVPEINSFLYQSVTDL